MPGDPEATLYLTVGRRLLAGGRRGRGAPASRGAGPHGAVAAGGGAFSCRQLRPDGTWPSFLAAGWHAAGLLHEQQFFYESARVQLVLGDRLADMSPADVAAMAAALRRVNLGDDWLLQPRPQAARPRPSAPTAAGTATRARSST